MRRKMTLFIAMVLGTMMLCGCGKTANLNKYVEIEVSGYNGYGEVTVTWDDEAWRRDFKDLEFTDSRMKMFYETPVDCVKDSCVTYEMSETEGLKNGDVITLSWECDDALAEELASVKLKYSDIDFIVKGLEEIPEFDPFAVIDLQYSGVAPYGSVSIKKKDWVCDKASYLNYTIDKSNGLKNGDVVMVTLSRGDDKEYMLELLGAVPTENSKMYTVEGLDYYAISLDDIDGTEMYKEMDAHAQDLCVTEIAKTWDDPKDFRNIELIGNYFLRPKKQTSNSPCQNYVDFVYKITAYDKVAACEFDYYWYCGFVDVMVLADGTVSADISEAIVPEGSYSSWRGVSGEAFERENGYYIGFATLDDLFLGEVTSSIDEYTYESTVQ